MDTQIDLMCQIIKRDIAHFPCTIVEFPLGSGAYIDIQYIHVPTHMMNTKSNHGAPLDPDFQPAALLRQAYRDAVRESDSAVPVIIGIERNDGLISRYETSVLPDPEDERTGRYVERMIKFLLWSRGGWKIHFGGPEPMARHVRNVYASDGARAFDVDIMQRIYERSFEVVSVPPEDVPPEQASPMTLGGHLEGCRIGFDLGASDFKLAAVQDGEVFFSDEIPWDPKNQPDPSYHYERINEGLKRAAARLPRVDAIGGSSAGVVVNNRMMVASLFRSVPADRFEEARAIFERLQKEWGVPLEVVNDGEVTALAGAMSLGSGGVLGIAMGSSEAVGYITPEGRITGWLDELAFAPVDFNSGAAVDEWSGDTGVGAQYFSQQAVNKLAPAAGIAFPDDLPLPERLKEVQRLMEEGDRRASLIYETLGVYLGYTIPWYAEFYDIRHVLALGRVLSGSGGRMIIDHANRILEKEFPALAEKINLALPDEKSRRVGQAVAAASLPSLRESL